MDTTPRKPKKPSRQRQTTMDSNIDPKKVFLQHCGGPDCTFAKENHTIADRLSAIEKQIALILQNFIDMREFVNMAARVTHLENLHKEHIQHLEERLEQTVTQTEFKPIRMFIYGTIGLALTTLGAAILTLVIRHG